MTHPIEIHGLEKTFRGVRALNGLELEVPEGSVYGLIGPNGAGKTTTLKVLVNALKPGGGSAKVLGTDSRRLGPEDFQRIGFVSEGQELPLWMTVDYLLSYLEPFYPDWDGERAAQMLRQLDLPGDRKLGQLSRGMRMKASLVSSLAYHPRLLILDEPFSGLDPMVREDLVESLAEIAEETTILISSHDLGDIETFASHIAYMDHGQVKFSEEMASLTDRFREVEVTLTSPAASNADRVWPDGWLRPQESPAFVRFVETRFDPDETQRAIRRLFGDVGQVSVSPMPLRSIFVAMARSTTRRPA